MSINFDKDMGMIARLIAAVGFSLLVCHTTPAAATAYTVQTFNFAPPSPYPDIVDNFLYGINDAGQIVGGVSEGCNKCSYGAVATGGTITTLPPSNAPLLQGINNLGQILTPAGYYNTDGSFVPTVSVGVASTVTRGINDLGQVVGSYSNYYCCGSGGGSVPTSGFLYSNGVARTINFPGATRTYLRGINDSGSIVGVSDTSAGSFLDIGVVFTSIVAPGASSTSVTGINNAGQIVGTALYAALVEYDVYGVKRYYQDYAHVGFVDSGGSFDLITVPGARDTFAEGINDLGQVVGYYDNPDWTFTSGQSGFIATPSVTNVPEPGSLSILGIGLVGCIGAGLLRQFRLHRLG